MAKTYRILAAAAGAALFPVMAMAQQAEPVPLDQGVPVVPAIPPAQPQLAQPTPLLNEPNNAPYQQRYQRYQGADKPVNQLVGVTPVEVKGKNLEPNPNVAVQNRPRPEYDPIGFRTGAVFFYPTLELATGYDSNVFVERDAQGSLLFKETPGITMESDFGRNAIVGSLAVPIGQYTSHSEQNYVDVNAALGGTVDVKRDAAFTGGVTFDRLHQTNEDPNNSSAGIDPTIYYRYGANLIYAQRFNRLTTSLGGEARYYTYDDANGINNQDRNRGEYSGELRVGYDITSRYNVFVQAGYTQIVYQDRFDDAGIDRSGYRYGAQIGTEINITSILFGEVFAGYQNYHVDDPTLADSSGLTFGGELTWNVTPLTSLGLGLVQEFVPTTEPGATSTQTTSIQLEAHHELLRNLILSANVGYIRDDFDGVQRTDDIYGVGAGVEYLFSRHFSAGIDYEFTDRSSDDPEAEFNRNVVMLTVTGKL